MLTIPEGFKGEKAIVTPYNQREIQKKNPITQQLYLTHIGYYPSASYHQRDREEGANENIIIYCEKGNGWIRHRGETHKMSRDTAYIIPANEPHSYGSANNNPWSIYWLHFCGENVKMFDSILGKVLYINDTENSRQEDRFKLFEEMYSNLEMGYNIENLEFISFCLMYFLASLKYITQFRTCKNVRNADTIQKCILYMKDNLENNITLEDIAEVAGYSTSHLNVLFAKRTLYSPMTYYNQLRIQRACTYLQLTDLKISEIAYKLGYYDPFHFSKAFSKEMKLSPKKYKSKYYKKFDQKSIPS